MGKSTATVIGILLIAVAAIYFGRSLFTTPEVTEEEAAEAEADSILTGNFDPRLELVDVVQDADLPDGVPAPKIGEDALHVTVEVLYPGVPEAPQPGEHRLARINGAPRRIAKPCHVETEEVEEGVIVRLLFRVETDFEQATLVRGNTIVVPSVDLE